MRKFLLALPVVAVAAAAGLLVSGGGSLWASPAPLAAAPAQQTARAEAAASETDVASWIETKKAAKPKPKKSALRP
ncbi:hypothetical protein [Gemmata sp.]|uniref:hypothetical protein n=1 Tax=Gemmata sp. TaxID=1914242 RepID=UPI003F729EF9